VLAVIIHIENTGQECICNMASNPIHTCTRIYSNKMKSSSIKKMFLQKIAYLRSVVSSTV